MDKAQRCEAECQSGRWVCLTSHLCYPGGEAAVEVTAGSAPQFLSALLSISPARCCKRGGGLLGLPAQERELQGKLHRSHCWVRAGGCL